MATYLNLPWTIEDKSYAAGDVVSAEFKVSNFNKIVAYQFAMKYNTDNLQFVGVEFPADNPLGLSTNCFSWAGKAGYRVKPNELRHLFSNPYGKTLADDTTLFKYVFKAKADGLLSENLGLATCCLNPPLNPMSYRFPLDYQTLTVKYTIPAESQEDILN